jgi:SAM-dependent methyltransferase
MIRNLDRREFARVFDHLIVRGQYHEAPDYYLRYRSRYEALTGMYAKLAPPRTIDFLDIGAGVYASLVTALWSDRSVSADLGGKNYDYMRKCGVEPVEWNLCHDIQPFINRFDVIMFSEVIEHLPLPGHVVLERLRIALKPGGLLICTTPNFYRLRNVVYMAIGKQIYDHFRMPTDRGLGHVIEYDPPRLRWQLERAGFIIRSLDLRHHPHQSYSLPFRILSWVGSPLYFIPRFRGDMVSVAQAPCT